MSRAHNRNESLVLAAGILLAAIAALAVFSAAKAEAFIYWSNASGTAVGRANLDGTGVDLGFVPAPQDSCGSVPLAVDPSSIWWGGNTGAVGHAEIDGSDVDGTYFASGGRDVCGIAVDQTYAYWTHSQGVTPGQVARARLDKTTPPELSFFTTADTEPCGIAVNESNIYWANFASNSIGRGDIAGANPPNQAFISPANSPCGLAVNSAHIYWAQFGSGLIGRANLDGSGVDPGFINTGGGTTCGVAVDDEHVYWTTASASLIGRADLDGGNPDPDFMPVPGPVGTLCGIAVDSLLRQTATSVSCTPREAAFAQPSVCAVIVTDTTSGPPSPPVGTASLSSASSDAAFIPHGDCTLVPVDASRSSCSVVYRPGHGTNFVLGYFGGDVRHDPSQGVGQVVVSGFSLGAAVIGDDGTAVLPARVPGPGQLTLAGAGVIPQATHAAAAGTVPLTVQADAFAQPGLSQTGTARVNASVAFTPDGGGSAGTGSQEIILRTPRRQIAQQQAKKCKNRKKTKKRCKKKKTKKKKKQN